MYTFIYAFIYLFSLGLVLHTLQVFSLCGGGHHANDVISVVVITV